MHPLNLHILPFPPFPSRPFQVQPLDPSFDPELLAPSSLKLSTPFLSNGVVREKRRYMEYMALDVFNAQQTTRLIPMQARTDRLLVGVRKYNLHCRHGADQRRAWVRGCVGAWVRACVRMCVCGLPNIFISHILEWITIAPGGFSSTGWDKNRATKSLPVTRSVVKPKN